MLRWDEIPGNIAAVAFGLSPVRDKLSGEISLRLRGSTTLNKEQANYVILEREIGLDTRKRGYNEVAMFWFTLIPNSFELKRAKSISSNPD